MNEEDKNPENDLESILNIPTDVLIPKEIDVDVEGDDFEFVRKNIKLAIEQGNIAMSELMEIAQQSGHPRAFEVLTMHMKNLVDSNRQLVESKMINEKTKFINKRQDQPNEVNQHLHITTAELGKMLENIKKD